MLKSPQTFVFPELHRRGAAHISQSARHPLLLCSPSAAARGRSRRWSLSVTAGYKRVPMDTAGAYQLIDEDTGEKVIVWGGTDVLEAPVPPQDVLAWKPDKRRPRKERTKSEVFDAKGTPTVSGGDSKHVKRVGASVGGFDRLKSQNIRALIKKSSKVTKENAQSDTKSSVDGTSSDEADGIESVESLNTKSTLDLLRRKHLHREKPNSEKVEDTNSLQSAPKQDIRLADTNPSVSRVWVKQHRKRSTDSGFFSRKSFKELGGSDDIIESLRSQMFLRPSHIQAVAYGPVLQGKSCIIADQSGSGKTLAYLTPIIQRLRQEEIFGLGKSLPRSPRVIILVPTAELASQVLLNCRSMAKFGVPFRSMVATGGFRQKTQLDSLQQELDVLIATPGRFIYLLKEGFVQLTNLKCVVLDEVDILYGDKDFEQVFQNLIKTAPIATQYLFVTATLPIDIYNKLIEVFPDCEVAIGPGMHRTSSGLEEVLVDCSGDDQEEKNPDTAFLNKKTALMQLVEGSPVPKTIIFCNKIETCRKVENILRRSDREGFHIKPLPFHAALAQENRLSNMKEFLNSESEDSMFLICTDRASRGIDFTKVDHVILFDFPRDPSEYVRRVGRTARGAGGVGKAFVFVVGKQVSLARRILERNKKGHPLHEVPSAYELERSVL